jgi:hypothetical protein
MSNKTSAETNFSCFVQKACLWIGCGLCAFQEELITVIKISNKLCPLIVAWPLSPPLLAYRLQH